MFHKNLCTLLQSSEFFIQNFRKLRTLHSRRVRKHIGSLQHEDEHINHTNKYEKENFVVAQDNLSAFDDNLSNTGNSLVTNLKTDSMLANLKSDTQVIVSKSTQHEIIANCVSPLWKLPYTMELLQKHKRAVAVLNQLQKTLRTCGIETFPAQQTTTLCPLQDIIPSPVLHQYRNHDEFVVWKGVDADPKTVGFLTGSPVDPLTVCVPPTSLLTIKDQHKLVCQSFERFIRQNKHSTCLHFHDSPGVWRTITVRSSRAGHLMAIVVVHPHDLSEEDLDELKNELSSYFSVGPGAEVGLTSLYLQVCPHTRCTREQAPYQLLLGQPFIAESFCGLNFQLSPDTRFPVNVEAGELLYSKIRESTELSPYSTLLDVFCGTGSLSLPLAGSVRGVVGIDPVIASVEDANYNARQNGITNASFIPGPVNKVLPLLTSELRDCTDVVAVVNARRGGLSNGVIKSMRENPSITKLLYTTSDVEGKKTFDNFVHLGSVAGKSVRNMPPMLPRFAFSVDMFPLSKQLQMGILFLKQ